MMKMKHIIALCLVLALVLPSTAVAATNPVQPKLVMHVAPTSGKAPLKVTFSYTLTGAKEASHTWYMGNGFSCHCTHRTYTYTKPGTYTAKLVLKTTTGKILTTTKTIHVYRK